MVDFNEGKYRLGQNCELYITDFSTLYLKRDSADKSLLNPNGKKFYRKTNDYGRK